MNSIETEVLKLIGEKTSDPDVFDTTGIDFIRDSINDAYEYALDMLGRNPQTLTALHVLMNAIADQLENTNEN